MSRKIRVVSYHRVSTTEQAEEGYSLEAQEEACRAYAKREGKEYIRGYSDRGISGKSIEKRLALQQLIRDSEKGEFDEVLVWKTNRLARNHLDLLHINEILKNNNVTFRSLTEPFETTTPAGKLLMNMLASIGEFERDTIVENVKMGMNQRAKMGKWNGGKVLGYKSVPVAGGDSETRLEIVPEEVLIVREIFNLYSEGKGLRAITNILNHKGYKTSRNRNYSVNTVKQILHNPLYIGKIRFNRYVDWGTKRRKGKSENCILADGEHEPIITESLWNKVHEIYKSKAGKPSRVYEGSYPLTGLLRCPVCGAGMVAARTTNTLKDGTKRTIRYYYCGNFKNKGSAVCRSNSVRADYAEEYVFQRIKEVILNDTVLKDIIDNINEDREKVKEPLQEELKMIQDNMKELMKRQDRLLDTLESGKIDESLLVDRLRQIKEQIDFYEERKKEINLKVDDNISTEHISFEHVKEVMMNFQQLLEQAPAPDKKMLLQLLIKKITVTDRKKIDTIEIDFNEGLQKHLLNIKGESSNNEGSLSFYAFKIAI